MVIIKWTRRAVAHIETIAEYLEQDSYKAAQSFVDTIFQKSIQIEKFPFQEELCLK